MATRVTSNKRRSASSPKRGDADIEQSSATLSPDLGARGLLPDEERTAAVARSLVDAGRFVPALTRSADGRGRAEWWPLPAVGDRDMIAALVVEDLNELNRADPRATNRISVVGTRSSLP